MNLFQWVAIPVAALFALNSLVQLARGKQPRWIYLTGVVVWTLAAVTIAVPDSSTTVAQVLGITRGADLLTYVLAIAFIVVSFYLYNRNRQLTLELTTLTRHIALQSARPPLRDSTAADPQA